MVKLYTGTEFYKLLKQFQKCVNNSDKKYKHYNKMPYNKWKVFMASWCYNDATVTIDYDFWGDDGDPYKATIELCNQNYNSYYFNGDDKGFGTFLADVMTGVVEVEGIVNYSTTTSNSITGGSTTTWLGDPYVDHDGSYTAINTGIATACKAIWEDPIDELKKEVSEIKNKICKKGDKDMKGFNFDFGFCTGDNVKMSMYGLAIKNTANTYVAYDAKTGNVVDVDCFNFDGGKYMFKMPVAIKDIKKGDVVIHNRVPMFVIDTVGGIKVVDIREGEKKEIMPTTNMFGFNFVTKVVSIFDGMGQATADAPFGNMLPLMMMGDSKGDNDAMLMFMMMQGQNGCADMFSNPMMMYFMMKDSKDSDMLPLMMMMNMNKPAVAHKCKCGGGCGGCDHEE